MQERDEVPSWHPGCWFRGRELSFVPEEFSPGAKKWICPECNEVKSGSNQTSSTRRGHRALEPLNPPGDRNDTKKNRSVLAAADLRLCHLIVRHSDAKPLRSHCVWGPVGPHPPPFQLHTTPRSWNMQERILRWGTPSLSSLCARYTMSVPHLG